MTTVSVSRRDDRPILLAAGAAFSAVLMSFVLFRLTDWAGALTLRSDDDAPVALLWLAAVGAWCWAVLSGLAGLVAGLRRGWTWRSGALFAVAAALLIGFTVVGNPVGPHACVVQASAPGSVPEAPVCGPRP